jgi:signal transduction histidine kinase
MTLAMGMVLALNLLVENREARAALEDYRRDQGRLAQAAASVVQARLGVSPSASVTLVLNDLKAMEHQGLSRVFVQAPGQAWMGTSGQPWPDSPLAWGAVASDGAFMVPRDRAAALGLPGRMAALGFASVPPHAGAPWKVAVAATVYRERDRDRHARWRLVASFTSTACFLFLLIRYILRLQKKELELAREIELRALTARKDQELNQANRAATVLTLASGVAHEIATPLGVISGRAGQLNGRLGEDERGQRLVQTILEEVDHINQTVRRFLDLARGGTAANEDVDPVALMKAAAAKVEHRFAKAGVELGMDWEPDLAHLRGDARLLEHLLVNLLLNACDACPPGTRVDLTARFEQGGLSLEVLDQGKGIPEDLAERVMEPFFTTKPRGLGSGLGLPIAKEIVRMHMGRLTFARVQPVGTRVRVWLPLA